MVRNKPLTRMGRRFWLIVWVVLALLALAGIVGAYYANGRWGLQ